MAAAARARGVGAEQGLVQWRKQTDATCYSLQTKQQLFSLSQKSTFQNFDKLYIKEYLIFINT
jgi:hypothetical protein